MPRSMVQAGPTPRLDGMTVIEILFAIAMVGVLAAIGMAAYGRYEERARIYQATVDIGGMGAQITQYAQDRGWEYPETLEDAGLGGRLDPWGRPYRYMNLTTLNGKGKARKDKWLNPVNSDFDLYSVGPDGASVSSLNAKPSRDDIVRASDGRFVGVAEGFDP